MGRRRSRRSARRSARPELDGRTTSRRSGSLDRCTASSRSMRRDEVLRPAILWNDQRTEAECDLIREIDRPRAPDRESPATTRFPGSPRPSSLWVRRARARRVVADRARPAAEGFRPPPPDGRLTPSIARTAPGRSCSTSRRATGRPRSWTRSASIRAWLPETYEGPEITGVLTAGAADATGLRAGTPVVAGGGDQAAAAVGVGAVEPGVVSLSLGTSGRRVRHDRRSADRAGGPAACVLPRRAGPVARDGRDAVGRRQPPLVPRCARAGRGVLRPRRRGARRCRPGSDGLLFLPYLSGERTPYPDPARPRRVRRAHRRTTAGHT